MTRIGNVVLAGKLTSSEPVDKGAVTQLGSIPLLPNKDDGVAVVQGRAPNGKAYVGMLIQRVYGTGQVRFYLKGDGDSHRLPKEITSQTEAVKYARQQISKGVWTDFPVGHDQRAGQVQGRAPNGTVLAGDLTKRIYSSGAVMYFFNGQNSSHEIPTSIKTTAEARVYARQQISRGNWTEFNKGDQAAFTKRVSSVDKSTKPQYPKMLAVDFGNPTPALKIGSFIIGDRSEIQAINKAKYRGYLPDPNDPRYVNFPNDAKGGEDLAKVNFSGEMMRAGCIDDGNNECRLGGRGFNEDKGLSIPKGASPEFMESYKKTARLYGQKL